MNSGKNNLPILFTLVISGALFSLISLVNHYNFRTYAFDLGIVNNAIFDFAHFRSNTCTLLLEAPANFFAIHFSLLPLILSPLYWIFGSYTMLIVQVAAILWGGYGIYIYFSSKTNNAWLPLLAMIHFFSMWGIYSALAFDYHDNVLGAMFVPWFLHYFNKEKWKAAIIYFTLILISKENMALWAVFISIALMAINYKQIVKRNYAICFGFAAMLYFILIVTVIMPSFDASGEFHQFNRYAALGETPIDVIETLFTKPRYLFTLLFENTGDAFTSGIKSELHFMVLISGGIALLYRPWFLFMLLPVYAQKLFTNDYLLWGINYHYSVEFAPVLCIAFFSWVLSFKSITCQRVVSVLIAVVTFAATISALDARVSKWYSPENSRFYQARHYKTKYDVKEVYKALKIIPENASVSAKNSLIPHLANRENIYQFPLIADAEYIVLLDPENTYPVPQEVYNKVTDELIRSKEWVILYDQNYTLILKRK